MFRTAGRQGNQQTLRFSQTLGFFSVHPSIDMKVLTDLRRFVSAWHLRDVRGMLGIVEILQILLILDIPLQTAEGKRIPDDAVIRHL